MPALSLSQTLTLITDVDGDGAFDPGDGVRVVATLGATGGGVAQGASYLATLTRLTEVAGTIRITPIAYDDSYTLTGNTPLTVTAGAGVLANDRDPDGAAVGLTAVAPVLTDASGAATRGTVTLNADGSFSFTPETGFTGTTGFKYTANDAQGLNSVVTGQVTLTVGGPLVWYVDSAYAGGGSDGSYLKPYTSLAPLNGAANNGATTGDSDGAGDTIFVYDRGVNAYEGGITLEANQTLLGDGENLIVNGLDVGASSSATRLNFNAAGVTLSTGNTLRGLTLFGGGASAVALQDGGGSVGALTISGVSVSGQGKVADIDQGGALSVNLLSANSTGSASELIDLQGVSGTLNIATGSLTAVSGTGINVSGGSISGTIGATLSNSGTNAALSVGGGHTGALTFNGRVSSSNGPGLAFNNADGTYSFAGGAGLTSATATGLAVTNGSAGTLTFAAGSSIVSGQGGITVTDSSATVSWNGSVTLEGSGTVVNVARETGGSVTINGAVTRATGAGTSIFVTGNTGGVVTFNGPVQLTNGSAGVVLTNNGGASVTFNTSGAGLDIASGAGVGFEATGGGTVTVTGTGNTITSTLGRALNISNTTIGSSGLTFEKISTNGAANGIVLDTTGSAGGLTLTGADSDANGSPDAGSGGAIQNSAGGDGATAGNGVYLNNTANVRLNGLNITGSGNSGVLGARVNGLVLDRVSVTGNGTNEGFDEAGVILTELTGTAANGANPTVIRNSTVSNNRETQLSVTNTLGTLTDLQLTANTLSKTDGVTGGNLVSFIGQGTASMTLTTSGGTYTGDGNGVDAPLAASGVQVNADGASSSVTAIISGGAFQNLTNGVLVTAQSSQALSLTLQNATITGSYLDAVRLFSAAENTGAVNATITGNTIGSAAAGSGSTLGSGIGVSNEGSTPGAATNLNISNNTVRNIASADAAAIQVFNGFSDDPFDPLFDATRTLNLTAANNVLSNVTGFGIEVRQVNTADPGILNASLSGNTFTGVTGVGGAVLRLQQRAGGTFNVQQAAPTGAVNAAELDDANGLTAAQINATGTITYNAAPPAQPMAVPGGEALMLAEVTGDRLAVATASPREILRAPEGSAEGGATGPVAAPSASVVTSDLQLEQLAPILAEAVARWTASGLTDAQLETLARIEVRLADVMGRELGAVSGGGVFIDRDAGGLGWFVDGTPADDAEFAAGSGARLLAGEGSAPAGRIDLLTVVMHELGHALGLGDLPASGRDRLMSGVTGAGERRLPAAGEASGATPGAITDAPATGPIAIGDIPSGKSVQVIFNTTADTQPPGLIQPISVAGEASGTNVATETVTTNATVDSLTLAGAVFGDADRDGGFDAGEGVAGVDLTLFADDGDGEFDAGDVQVATTVSGANGAYSFAGLAPGDYIVRVDAANFTSGNALFGLQSATTYGGDPDDDDDTDSNALRTPGQPAYTAAITLSYNGEPTLDGDDADTNSTLDLGFVSNSPPALDLSAAAAGTGSGTTFVEGGAAPVAAADATVTDPDGDNLVSATFTLVNRQAGDALTVTGTLPTGIIASYNPATAMLTLSGSATAAAYQAALRDNVRFTNGTDDPNATARTVTVVVNDGQVDSNTATATISVTGVNDAPTVAATGLTRTFVENGAVVPLFSGVAISTVEAGQSIDQIVLGTTGVVAGDVLTVDGAAIALGSNGTATTISGFTAVVSRPGAADAPVVTLTRAGGVTASEAAAIVGAATFSTPSDDPGAGARTVTLTSVRDTGGVANGGLDLATPNVTATVTVAPTNDAPTAAAPASLSVVEDVAYDLKGRGLTVGDVDGGSAIEAVTLSVTAGSLAATSGGGVTASGSGAALTLLGTAADLNAFLAGGAGTLTYTADLDDPPASTTLNLAIIDGGAGGPGGAPSVTASAETTLNITQVNDAPTATLTSANPSFTEGGPAVAPFSNADLSTVEASQRFARLGFTVSNVQANDTLTVDGVPIALFTGSSGPLTRGGLSYSSSISNGQALVTVSASTYLTESEAEALVNGVRFAALGDNPIAGDRVVALVDLADNGFETQPAAPYITVLNLPSTVIVVAVNDAPDVTAPTSLAITEQVALSLRGRGLSVADADGGGAVQRLTLTVAGATLAATAGNSGVTLTPVTGGLQIDGTLSDINYFLGSAGSATLTVTTASDDPATVGPLTLNAVLDDRGAGGGSVADALTDSAATTLNVTPVNDAPVVTTSAGSAAFTENADPAPVDSGLTLTDADSPTLASATVSITAGFQAGADVLIFTNTSTTTYGNIAATYNGGTGVLTLTSAGATATTAQFQAALRAVTFASTSEDPSPGARTISFSADDGADMSVAATRTLNVTPVNDAPTASASPTGATFTEGGAAADVFTGVSVSTGEAGQSISGLQITVTNARPSDVLGDDAAFFISLIDGFAVSLPGRSYSVAVTNGTAVVTVSFPTPLSAGDAAAYLDALVFAAAGDNPGSAPRTLTLSAITDTGGVADGGRDTAAPGASSTIQVVPVNDAPTDVAVASGALSVAENTASGTLVATLAGVDPDDTAFFYVLQDSAGGRFALDGQGRLTVADGSRLDFEQATSHVIRVQVRDVGGLSFSRTLTVQVTDVASEAVSGTAGGDTLAGGGGDDVIYGLAGADDIQGGAGADVLYGNQDNDILAGGAGMDRLAGGQGDDQLFGGDDADLLEGGVGADLISGGGGIDTAAYTFAPGGVTVTLLNPGASQNTGAAGIDTLFGIENLAGSAFNDLLTGDAGDNRLAGGGGSDVAYGGFGRDTLLGEAGDDVLFGNQDNDVMSGGDGRDVLYGGQGADALDGGDGDDLLQGGIGADVLTGGAGADVFRYVAAADSPVSGFDLLTDFQSGADVVDLRAVRTGAGDAFAITSSGGQTFLDVDLGGEGGIDLRIVLTGTNVLQNADVLWT